jgi:hypothetical protein
MKMQKHAIHAECMHRADEIRCDTAWKLKMYIENSICIRPGRNMSFKDETVRIIRQPDNEL